MGLPVLPALAQAFWTSGGRHPLWGGLMAPPGDLPGDVTLQQLHRGLHQFLELGTVYTMIAGLLNILAIYDACCCLLYTSHASDSPASADREIGIFFTPDEFHDNEPALTPWLRADDEK